MDAMRLEGKSAIVTGAAGALGSAAAQALAREGASVLVADIDLAGADRVAETIRDSGGVGVACRVDVALEGDIRSMVGTAVETFGGLDVLLNNAGLVGLEHKVDLLSLDVELWDRVLGVNLRSVMLGCKHAVPAMRARGGGSIINTSSDSSLGGDTVNYAYASAKAGVNTLTRYVATSYGRDGIRCNAIAPGIHLRTEDREAIAREGGPRARRFERFEEHCLVPRLGTPEDIANMVVFLASDESSYVTAQLIQVDGGLVGQLPHVTDERRDAAALDAAALNATGER
jgi:NAD(P)-dependent dehydrogenase (short-subunit alcohol dehydrogenase family)